MAENAGLSKEVAEAVKLTLQNTALKTAELQFGDVSVLISRGHRLQIPTNMAPVPEYPDVPTHLKDDKDSWLK
jgi:hypothetical protein